MTIPLILALARGDREFRMLVERLYAGSDDVELPAVLAGIAQGGGLDGTRDQIAQYAERAKLSLAPLGAIRARGVLAGLADDLNRE